jgi:hypothetical protein
MYPWNVLGINETDDKKAIKKAYAKLIRLYRPDEAPEKFQEINQAYKYALELLINQQVSVNVPAESHHPFAINQSANTADVEKLSIIQNNEIADAIAIETFETSVDESVAVENDNDTEFALGNEILLQFHQLAFAEYRIKKQIKSWAFLEQYHEIQDLQLRDSLSKEIFRRVVEYNNFQQQENGSLLLNQPMVRVIADILDWETHWLEFEQILPDTYVRHVFGLLQASDTSKRSASFAGRIFAIYMEIVAINFAVRFLGWHELNISRELVILMIFFGTSTLSSLSKLNVTVIQYFFDIRLFDRFINKPSFKQKLIRITVFHSTMTPIYMILIGDFKFSPWLEMSCIVVVIINLISWFKNKQLFHDWVSGTIMLK